MKGSQEFEARKPSEVFSPDQLKTMRNKLALLLHPDKNKDKDDTKMKLVNELFELAKKGFQDLFVNFYQSFFVTENNKDGDRKKRRDLLGIVPASLEGKLVLIVDIFNILISIRGSDNLLSIEKWNVAAWGLKDEAIRLVNVIKMRGMGIISEIVDPGYSKRSFFNVPPKLNSTYRSLGKKLSEINILFGEESDEKLSAELVKLIDVLNDFLRFYVDMIYFKYYEEYNIELSDKVLQIGHDLQQSEEQMDGSEERCKIAPLATAPSSSPSPSPSTPINDEVNDEAERIRIEAQRILDDSKLLKDKIDEKRLEKQKREAEKQAEKQAQERAKAEEALNSRGYVLADAYIKLGKFTNRSVNQGSIFFIKMLNYRQYGISIGEVRKYPEEVLIKISDLFSKKTGKIYFFSGKNVQEVPIELLGIYYKCEPVINILKELSGKWRQLTDDNDVPTEELKRFNEAMDILIGIDLENKLSEIKTSFTKKSFENLSDLEIQELLNRSLELLGIDYRMIIHKESSENQSDYNILLTRIERVAEKSPLDYYYKKVIC